jgi:hypothetical protein
MIVINAQKISRFAVSEGRADMCRAAADLWDFDMFMERAQSKSYAGSP